MRKHEVQLYLSAWVRETFWMIQVHNKGQFNAELSHIISLIHRHRFCED